ncbi:acyl transferase/acyl hydrolase/lysophospholipase [Cladochytrium replicatum]|nr:acyl transferase/acyl hydrolase/lysophospholipase [Cladochytrium replicatum]
MYVNFKRGRITIKKKDTVTGAGLSDKLSKFVFLDADTEPSAPPTDPVPSTTEAIAQVAATEKLEFEEEKRPSGCGANFCAPFKALKYKILDSIINPGVDDTAILKAFDELPENVRNKMLNEIINPEVKLDATVRRENHIPKIEKDFQSMRLFHAHKSFAKFIGVPVSEVDPRDIPIIGAAGSGGGFKAMIATAGYLKALQALGLYDVIMYISGVSGSCWSIANLYTAAKGNPDGLIEHFKRILGTHPADSLHLGKTLARDVALHTELAFGGLTAKYLSSVPRGVVDVFGSILYAHFHSDQASWDPNSFKLSQQARLMQNGAHAMPLYTACRHERPWDDKDEGDEEEREADAKVDPWWQWFEMSPYEIGCDELRAWIPTYSFGRTFEGGKSIDRVPEQSFGLQVGLIGSAISAPFTTTLETLERSDAKQGLAVAMKNFASSLLRPEAPRWIKRFLSESILNGAINRSPFYKIDMPTIDLPDGEKKKIRLPSDMQEEKYFELVDAGADNNQGLYPLAREGRGVDVAFVFDASVDVERNIVTVDIERFGTRKCLAFTRTSPSPPDVPAEAPPLEKASAAIAARYANRYCQVFHGKALGGIGPHDEPAAEQDMTLLYMPVLPNPKHPKFGPSEFVFTQLVYKPEDVAGLANCAYENMIDSADAIRATLKMIWMEKRAKRTGHH